MIVTWVLPGLIFFEWKNLLIFHLYDHGRLSIHFLHVFSQHKTSKMTWGKHVKHDCENFHIYRCWFQRFCLRMFYLGWVFGDGAHLAVNPILNLIKVLCMNHYHPSIRPDLISQGWRVGPLDYHDSIDLQAYVPPNIHQPVVVIRKPPSMRSNPLSTWMWWIGLWLSSWWCAQGKNHRILGGGNVPHRKFVADFLEAKKEVHVEAWIL